MNNFQTNALHHLVAVPGVATKAVTVSSAAVTIESLLTNGVLDQKTQYVLISIEGADVRFCPDGTTPNPGASPPLGHPYLNGSRTYISAGDARNGKWIRNATTDATLQVTQYLGS